LARMTQWLVLSMLASMDYLRKKGENDSRELRSVKRRCYIWSTSLISRRLAMHQGTSLAIVSPWNYDEAMQFDLKNCNTLWWEATNL
jgi:hypothetical protein